MRPTHFIGMRIQDENIQKKMEIFQKQVIQEYPKLEKYKIPPEELHFTLAVLKIEKEEIKSTKLAFGNSCMRTDLPKLEEGKFKGIGQFDEKVLCMKLENDKNLKLFRDYFIHEFSSENTCTILEKNREFKPHGTLFKVPFNDDFKMPKGLLEKYSQFDFGSFKFDSIELNKMGGRETDGYYISEITIKFK
jgi:2'-5' RNA ligase